MCGIVLDRAVPHLPGRVPARGDRTVRAGRSGARSSATCPPRGPRSSPARRGAPADRPADRLHERRFGVPDRRPTWTWSPSRRCRSGAGSPAASSVGEHRVGRVIARPFAGEPGSFVADPRPARLLGGAPRPDPARPPASRRGSPSYGVGQDRRHLRRAGPDRVPLLALERRRRRPHARLPPAPRTGARLRQPRGLRLEVRAPQRPRGVRRGASRPSTGRIPELRAPSATGCSA